MGWYLHHWHDCVGHRDGLGGRVNRQVPRAVSCCVGHDRFGIGLSGNGRGSERGRFDRRDLCPAGLWPRNDVATFSRFDGPLV